MLRELARRAWVWAFGPGDFGGALLWTLAVALAPVVLVFAVLAVGFAGCFR